MNNCSFVGRLVRDVQIRESKSGAKVLFNRLAVRAPRKDEEDLFINFVVFGKGAEVIAEYRQKGAEVVIAGRIRPGRPWTDAQGNEQQDLEVVVENVSLVGGSGQQRNTPKPQEGPVINPFTTDGDIPY